MQYLHRPATRGPRSQIHLSWTCLPCVACFKYVMLHTHTHTHVCAQIYIYTHTHTYVCAQIYIHTHTYMHMHKYIHTHTYMRAHKYIHPHTHTYIHNTNCSIKLVVLYQQYAPTHRGCLSIPACNDRTKEGIYLLVPY